MGIYSVKPRFQQSLTPAKNYFVKHKVHPNYINTGGLLVSIAMAFCLFYANTHIALLFLIPLLAFIRTALNALDGLVSRELAIASGFGEVLNEFFDRISDTIIFLSLALNPSSNYFLGTITIIIILLNSYLSIVSKAAGGKRQYGGFMGKADRMIYLSIAAVLVGLSAVHELWTYFFLFTIIGTLITMMQRFAAIKRELS